MSSLETRQGSTAYGFIDESSASIRPKSPIGRRSEVHHDMAKAEFRAALEAWVRAALDPAVPKRVARRSKDAARIPIPGTGGGRVVDDYVVYWDGGYLERIKALPEWSAAEQAALTWEHLVEHYDHLSGTFVFGAGRKNFETFSFSCLPNPRFDAERQEVVEAAFDKGVFDASFARLEHFIECAVLRFESLVLLLGLQVEEGAYPVRLDAQVAIDRLTDEESQELVASNQPSNQNRWGPDQSPRFALRIIRAFPKCLGDDIPEDAGQRATDAHEELQKIVNASIIALSLTENGSVAAGPSITRGLDWESGSSATMIPILLSFGEHRRMILAEGDCATLARLYGTIRAKFDGLSNKVKVALRRFVFAMERREPDDKMLDHMIAAEALFLDDGNTAELKYRLSVRMAFALGGGDEHRRRLVFEDMQHAYDVRSKIAHGSQPRPRDLVIAGQQVNSESFVSAVGEHMRTALRIAIDADLPTDWDALIIGRLP